MTADAIERRLRTVSTIDQAEAEKRYLKSELVHLGATVWQIRREIRSFAKEHPALSHGELLGLVEELWAKPVDERRMTATFLLEASEDDEEGAARRPPRGRRPSGGARLGNGSLRGDLLSGRRGVYGRRLRARR